MTVKLIPPSGFASNTFAVTEDGENCILIDCAQPQVFTTCKNLGLVPRAVFLTHGHFDHVGGCGALYGIGAPIYCGEREKSYIFSADNRGIFGGVPIPEFEIFKTLCDGEEISLYGLHIKTVFTPGHTAGGVCYVIGDNLFSGDTLFYRGIGRSDLPGGNERELIQSVKKLYALGGDYRVFCGHGENTHLSEERLYNPYVRG